MLAPSHFVAYGSSAVACFFASVESKSVGMCSVSEERKMRFGSVSTKRTSSRETASTLSTRPTFFMKSPVRFCHWDFS